MRLSGQVIDVYDDMDGSVLRSIYPTAEALPGSVKTASPIHGDTRHRLPDGVFALVVQENGEKLRKFACTDPGNVELSMAYFDRTAGRLTSEMRKTAADNLIIACAWYGLEPSEGVVKAAGLMDIASKGMKAYQALGVAKDVANKASTVSAMGPGLFRPQQVEAAQAAMGKMGEANGTEMMPLSPKAVTPNPTEGLAKTVIKKSASDTGVNKEIFKNSLVDIPPVPKAPPRLPQAKTLQPHVDAHGVSHADIAGGEKKASKLYALGNRYPLDGYDQVKTAARYFDEYGQQFSPEERREYCRNLVKRANDLGIAVSDRAMQYGAGEISLAAVKVAADLRRVLIPTPQVREAMDVLEKHASLGASGEDLVESFGIVDRAVGIERFYGERLPDPVLSVYAWEKQAEFSDDVGGEHVMGKDLHCLSRYGRAEMRNMFAHDLVDEFSKDPVGIYKSLPREQKILVARLAKECAATHGA